MAEFTIHTDDITNGSMKPVAEALVLLKNLIQDESLLYDLDLSLTEACANVVKHAYPEHVPHKAEIRVKAMIGTSVEIEISDWGTGMDSDQMPSQLPEAQSETGRGISLMTSLCDRVTFYSDKGKHTVSLFKYVPTAAWRH